MTKNPENGMYQGSTIKISYETALGFGGGQSFRWRGISKHKLISGLIVNALFTSATGSLEAASRVATRYVIVFPKYNIYRN